MTSSLEYTRVKPLLASYAVARTGNAKLAGRYDPSLDFWVIDTPDGIRPIIEITVAGETSTVTRVRAEQDDTDVSPALMASTSTFTKVAAEGDDTDLTASPLAEVSTKTYAQLESDDHAPTLDLTHPQAWGDGQTVSRRFQ